MTEYAPIYGDLIHHERFEGWAEVVERDTPNYMADGSHNPYVFAQIRLLSDTAPQGRLIEFRSIRTELPQPGEPR